MHPWNRVSLSLGAFLFISAFKGVNIMKVIDKNGNVSECSFESEEGRIAFRHTTAHVLAQAVKHLYPDVKLTIGPAISDGFYYDFDCEKPFTNEDFPAIEAEMHKIVKENLPLEQFNLPRAKAIALMEKQNEPYKIELINDLPEDEVLSFFKQGDFVDLCAGPHLKTTGAVGAFKLISVAGAYWRGDEKNKMLCRIYGTAFPKAADLEAHLAQIEEAKRRDHRKLGRQLGLFELMDEGVGMPFFLPDGMTLKNTLISYWREIHQREG